MVDDMVIETRGEESYADDLRIIFDKTRRYDMRLNPAKGTFGVQEGKFLGFMITERSI